MSAIYYVVTVQDAVMSTTLGKDVKLRFVFTPTSSLKPDVRSVDEILMAACNKGAETSFCSRYSNVPKRDLERIDFAVLAHLRESLKKTVKTFDVSIDVDARIRL